MVKGLGTDIIEIDRIAGAIRRHGKRFLDKVFTPREQSYCLHHSQSERHFAGRFAAKEAILKALGTGLQGASWRDVEIINDDLGKPQVLLSGILEERFLQEQLLVTISHCRNYATATAILLQ
jgi:holo-[acyl-carrier protein] synthase